MSNLAIASEYKGTKEEALAEIQNIHRRAKIRYWLTAPLWAAVAIPACICACASVLFEVVAEVSLLFIDRIRGRRR
jgi:hypothetical protein